MIYRKNLYAWEQWSRILVGVALAGWATWAGLGLALTVVLVASGIGFALTGLLGFCPACYIAGRKLNHPTANPTDG